MKIVEFSKARKPTVIREAQRQKQRQRKNQLPLKKLLNFVDRKPRRFWFGRREDFRADVNNL